MKEWLFVAVLAIAAPAAAQSQIQPAAVKVAGSPNVLAWPVTTRIARLELADQGVRVTFDKCATWPDVTPPGWGGPLRFTLWLFENIGGEWYASGIIQFWACDQFNGGAVYQDNQIARNWVYDSRWSAMVGHQPAPGERIGFMVSAGNARGQDDHLVAERSDIVEVLMPSAAVAYPPAPFAAVEGVFVPPPIVPPPSISVPPSSLPCPSGYYGTLFPDCHPIVLPPPPAPPLDLSGVYAQLAALKADVAASRSENQQFYEEARSTWKDVLTFVGKYVAPSLTALGIGLRLGK